MASIALPVPEGLSDFLPVQMVLHGGRIRRTVIAHRAVCVHPGDPGIRPQRVQIGLPRKFHAVGDVIGLCAQLTESLFFIVLKQHSQKQSAAEHQHQHLYQQIVLKYFLSHLLPSSL